MCVMWPHNLPTAMHEAICYASNWKYVFPYVLFAVNLTQLADDTFSSAFALHNISKALIGKR